MTSFFNIKIIYTLSFGWACEASSSVTILGSKSINPFVFEFNCTGILQPDVKKVRSDPKVTKNVKSKLGSILNINGTFRVG